jgi:hypothetical protein
MPWLVLQMFLWLLWLPPLWWLLVLLLRLLLLLLQSC